MFVEIEIVKFLVELFLLFFGIVIELLVGEGDIVEVGILIICVDFVGGLFEL